MFLNVLSNQPIKHYSLSLSLSLYDVSPGLCPQVFMRAMVDYSPQQDWSLPCPDVGMSFRKGQLLEVVDQTDAHWWQARRLPPTASCAGLIPSASMLKR